MQDEQSERPSVAVLIVGKGSARDVAASRAGAQRQIVAAAEVLVASVGGPAVPLPEVDLIAVISPGDLLLPHTVAELRRHAAALFAAGGPVLAYCDEHTVDRVGRPSPEPVRKPGWSPVLDLQLSLLTGVVLMDRRSLAEQWSRPGSPGSVPGLLRRLAEQTTPVHLPFVACRRTLPPGRWPGESPQDIRLRTERAAARAGLRVQVGEPTAGVTPVRAVPAEPLPRVAVVIPTRDQPDLIDRCLAGLAQNLHRCPLRVVVVDTGSTDPRVEEIYRRHRVTVVRQPGPFNFARACNAGIRAVDSDLILLLNDDTEASSPGWLDRLAAWATQPGIGAVGAQLRYPDGRLQHSGIMGMGVLGVGHVLVGSRPGRDTPLRQLTLTREVLAVTGACLMVSRAAYDEVGGLTEDDLPNDSGDVDLCLRLARSGRRTLVCNEAVLVHHESASRGGSVEDFARHTLVRRWLAELSADPYRHPDHAGDPRWGPVPPMPNAALPSDLFADWLAGRAEDLRPQR